MISVSKYTAYVRLMRLDKPVGIFLLLWPTLWGLWMAADGPPAWMLLCVFAAGVVLTRSAGCVVNDLADQRFDGLVKRTKKRPLVAGDVTRKEAWALLILLGALAVSLLWFLNSLARLIAVASAVLAVIYPFTKRVTYFPQCVLGVVFGGCPILMAFAAQMGTIPPLGWYLFLIAALWPMAYDTFYAMADREDDCHVGVKSMALLLGHHDRLFIASVQCLMLLSLSVLGRRQAMQWPYYVGLIIALGVVIHGCWLAKDRRPSRCFKAFLYSHWFGCSVFLGIALGMYTG